MSKHTFTLQFALPSSASAVGDRGRCLNSCSFGYFKAPPVSPRMMPFCATNVNTSTGATTSNPAAASLPQFGPSNVTKLVTIHRRRDGVSSTEDQRIKVLTPGHHQRKDRGRGDTGQLWQMAPGCRRPAGRSRRPPPRPRMRDPVRRSRMCCPSSPGFVRIADRVPQLRREQSIGVLGIVGAGAALGVGGGGATVDPRKAARGPQFWGTVRAGRFPGLKL